MSNYENIRPYAEFAHDAAQHGGVDRYLTQIADANYERGVLAEQETEGVKGLMVLGFGIALWEGGKFVYRTVRRKYQEHKAKKAALLRQSEEAMNEIKRNIGPVTEA